jgi:hypothetical protein
MRDIRDDLSERLRFLNARYADAVGAFMERMDELRRKHKAEIDAIVREREAVEALFSIEQGRLGDDPASQAKARRLMPLSDFLITTLCARGPMDKDALRAEVAAVGYFTDGANGRTFHTTLMNLVKHGKLYPSGNTYAAPAVPTFPLFQGTPVDDGDSRPLM